MPYFAYFLVHPWTRKLSIFMHTIFGHNKVLFFHDPSDPHSHLALEKAKKIKDIQIMEVSPPVLPQWMMDYKIKDALILSQVYDINFQPDKLHPGASTGNKLLHKLGHYQGAMFYYKGQWFSGLDRINFLLKQLSIEPLSPQWHKISKVPGKTLQFFFSFRSPYSFLAIYEVEKLIKELKIDIEFKPLLPMAMRGFKIPKSKKMYIFKDAARIAHHRNIPFGKVCDPLGEGVINVLKLFSLAKDKNQELSFCKIMFEAIWAKGQDVTKTSTLTHILSALSWKQEEIKSALEQEIPESLKENKEQLKSYGLWGVPSFKWGEFSTWGQDRIPLLREVIKASS